MAVPVSKLPPMSGVVLHLRGGVAAPSPPLWGSRAPAYSVSFRREVGKLGTPPVFADLFYIPPAVAATKNLEPGFYTTLEPGDEWAVVITATPDGEADHMRMARSLPRDYDRMSVHLLVDGVRVGNFEVATQTERHPTLVFEGWLGNVSGTKRSIRRFRVDAPKTRAVDSWEAGAATDDDPATAVIGSAVLQWCPSRLTHSIVSPSTGSAPAGAPTLSEREAMKNRSLAAGAGSSLVTSFNPMKRKRAHGLPCKSEEIVVYYRERRVLVARGILTKDGEVVPELRAKTGATSVKAEAARSTGVKAEGSLTGAVAKADVGKYGGGSAAGAGPGSASKKRKATTEIIILD